MEKTVDQASLSDEEATYVPIPHVALTALREPLEVATVVTLYREAQRRLWGPLDMTERRLAQLARVGRHVVQRVLLALQALGLVSKDQVQTGQRANGTVLTVYNPAISRDDDHGQRLKDMGEALLRRGPEGIPTMEPAATREGLGQLDTIEEEGGAEPGNE